MCYNVNQNGEQLELDLGADFKAKPKKRIKRNKPGHHLKGFAHPQLLVIATDKPDEIQEMEWGLVPFWVKSAEDAIVSAKKTLNARAETAFQLPSFRAAILKRRCIIPVNGFYEWRHFDEKTYPYFIFPKEESYFCLAGLWEEWTDKETGEIKRTCSIITTSPNPLMSEIHNTKERMPLILDLAAAKRWISADLKKLEIEAIMKPYPVSGMDYHTVSRLLTSRTEDSNVPEVTEPQEYAELPEITIQ